MQEEHLPENPSALGARESAGFLLVRAEQRVSPYHTHQAVKKKNIYGEGQKQVGHQRGFSSAHAEQSKPM